MHHREMVLSAQKRPRLAFLTLPEDLQDEIVDGPASGAMTLQGASELAGTPGRKLSHASAWRLGATTGLSAGSGRYEKPSWTSRGSLPSSPDRRRRKPQRAFSASLPRWGTVAVKSAP